jgi:phytanoyl-CoA dioxygenase PhyH
MTACCLAMRRPLRAVGRSYTWTGPSESQTTIHFLSVGVPVMLLSPELQSLLPSTGEVEAYREHGWYIAPKVLTEAVLDEALKGSDRHWAGERDWNLPIAGGFTDWKPGDPDAIRIGEIIALQNREIRTLVEVPVIGAIAARLAGTKTIRLWESELISKSPPKADPSAASAPVGWHTDRAYWMTCTSVEMLTAWIPFTDCPIEMGPLMVADGSHKWAGIEELREFQNRDLAGVEDRFLEGHGPVDKVSMALERGQMSFHNALTLHASDVNRTNRPRVSLALHLQDESNRYRPFRNERGELWQVVNDRMCRKDADGQPDYTDPEICPVLWTED